jgi:hypothetical protein
VRKQEYNESNRGCKVMKNARYSGKPLSFMEFSEKFATEEACRQKVFEAR